MPSDEEDQRLARRLARGDETALADLYDRFARPIYSLVMRVVNNERDAEEVVQDAFLTVWRNAANFDAERSSLFTWLNAISRNKAIDRLRATQRRIPAPPASENGTFRETVDDAVSPAREAADHDRADRVHAMVGELPPNQRQAIELAFFDGLTHPEIAERLQETVGTVKSRIRLGMDKLRQKVKGGRI